ncbi:hypothetical protein CDL15_Pgr020404 [Punica granatum]|uniref:Protein kinase domain-containing protein n=1 Tax=Punica granatum TaxID=22663 RepID=A0A218VV61_PUNGR|nr:hypothetical protein CDL15_Pgr020404 [Punica granatum]
MTKSESKSLRRGMLREESEELEALEPLLRKFLKDFEFENEDDIEFLQDAVDSAGALAFASETASSSLGAPSTGWNTSELWERRRASTVTPGGARIFLWRRARQRAALPPDLRGRTRSPRRTALDPDPEAGVPRLLLKRRQGLPLECCGRGHGVVVVRGEREAGLAEPAVSGVGRGGEVIRRHADVVDAGGGHCRRSCRGGVEEDQKIVAVKVLNMSKMGTIKSFLVECEALRNI